MFTTGDFGWTVAYAVVWGLAGASGALHNGWAAGVVGLVTAVFFVVGLHYQWSREWKKRPLAGDELGLPSQLPVSDERATSITDQILKAAESRDRLLVAGAAGTLVLSVTFVHDIAPTPISWTLWLLVISWAVLLVSLLASFVSMHTTEQALRRQLKGDQVGESQWNAWTRFYNWLAMLGVVVGVGMFATFASINLISVR